YTPNNTILVILGDVNMDAVLNAVKQTFGSIPGQRALAKLPKWPNSFTGYKNVVGKSTIKNRSSCTLGFVTPGFSHPDRYALEVLRAVLMSGQSSRLQRRLVIQDKLAANITPGIHPFRERGLMCLIVQPRSVDQTYRIPEVIIEEIIRLKKDGVTEE